VYDLDLTQLSTEIFPYVKTSYFEYTSLGSAMVKYTNERMYLVYESDAKYFIYDNEGKVEKTGTLRNPKIIIMHSIYKNMQLTLRQVIFLGMDGHHHTVLTKISF
jgi:hypothetical protein